MRTLIRLLIVLSILGGLGYAGYVRGAQWLRDRQKKQYRTAAVELGDMRITRNASGEIKPVLSVHVGSFVSGPIKELLVDFNDEVRKGQLLATIDQRIYIAAMQRDEAAHLTQLASVERVRAELQRAKNDEQRSLLLKAENPDFISQTDLDQFRFSRMSLEAQLTIAEASVKQALANLANSRANVDYTQITSPVDGIIIDKKIEPGQTLAASFQTPELFIIAPEMHKKMHIYASVDEADMGLIREAKESGQTVSFTVEAYPDEVFSEGTIEQIRLSSTVTQNVVTYPVIVATPNADKKLLPGMTAQLTFRIRDLKDVVRIPTEALNFVPKSKSDVREADQYRLDLNLKSDDPEEDSATTLTDEKPVDDEVTENQDASRQIVWVVEGDKLKAVDVRIGVENYRFAQMLEGDLKPGDQLVTGIKTTR